MATLKLSKNVCNKYIPIEYLMIKINDDKVISWLSDQLNCLTAIFKVAKYKTSIIKDQIDVGCSQCQIIRNNSEININVEGTINISEYPEKASCYHLKDGTVILFLTKSDSLVVYHCCFLDASHVPLNQLLHE